MAATIQIRAAQYVRMSTDKQIYSTANQKAAIAQYASAHNFDIVQTYADEGRSGLSIRYRTGLQKLLSDVLSGEREYQAILVFDISRWGRFQDADESAHYEFLCRKAGVHVHYCAELFDNDGSLASTILKSMRRVMASEYSRDLSEKVWTAQCRLAAQGHRMGGTAPYGMRRLLLDENGAPKELLGNGQWKNLRSDRVTLVPGPPEELHIVRRIFHLCGDRGLTDRRIAEILNRAKVPNHLGRPWPRDMISRMLRNEVYIGTNVFNRASQKLSGASKLNDRDQWVRCKEAFEPVISRQQFEKVQVARSRNRHIYSDEMLIDCLKKLLAREGKLSTMRINRSRLTPALITYRKRFGSLKRIYALAGYDKRAFKYVSVGRGLAPHAVVVQSEVRKAVTAQGGRIAQSRQTGLFTIDGTLALGISIARYIRATAFCSWRVYVCNDAPIDFVLVALMDRSNAVIERYCLLPRTDFPPSGRTCFVDGGKAIDRYRIDTLSGLYQRMITHSSAKT